MASGSRAPASLSSAPPQSGLHVLVVDDYEDARDLYAEYFSVAGYRTSTARDGVDAVAKATTDPPDAIAMDLAMPLMDGYEATRRLRADPRTSRACIIAVSGNADADSVNRAMNAGCDQFIAKPCSPQALVREVALCLARHRQP